VQKIPRQQNTETKTLPHQHQQVTELPYCTTIIMGEQCNIQTNFSEIFETKLFQNMRAVEFGHEVPLRYGYTNNITAVIAGDGNDSDYLKGLLASSITCFCFFLCWTLALSGL
jgi:hypothetical protein